MEDIIFRNYYLGILWSSHFTLKRIHETRTDDWWMPWKQERYQFSFSYWPLFLGVIGHRIWFSIIISSNWLIICRFPSGFVPKKCPDYKWKRKRNLELTCYFLMISSFIIFILSLSSRQQLSNFHSFLLLHIPSMRSPKKGLDN